MTYNERRKAIKQAMDRVKPLDNYYFKKLKFSKSLNAAAKFIELKQIHARISNVMLDRLPPHWYYDQIKFCRGIGLDKPH